jgi:hypothetical protein
MMVVKKIMCRDEQDFWNEVERLLEKTQTKLFWFEDNFSPILWENYEIVIDYYTLTISIYDRDWLRKELVK